MEHRLHCYAYVHQPFDAVRAALVDDAVRFFGPAGESAAERARALVGNLTVPIAGLEIGKRIVLHVRSVQPHAEAPGRVAPEALRVDLEWEADTHPRIFPVMKASILAYALSKTETQLDLEGTYVPPGGALGGSVDYLIGRRIAAAAVHRLLEDVAARLTAAVT